MNRMINRTVLSTVLVVLMCATMMAPAVAQEPTSPFVINGYVFDSNGYPCNDPSVAVTNTNTGVSEDAKKSSASNYYQLTLSSDDVSDGSALQFDVAGCSQLNTTPHTATQAEVGDGGFKLNITLKEAAVFDPVITSCNDTGAEQNEFYP